MCRENQAEKQRQVCVQCLNPSSTIEGDINSISPKSDHRYHIYGATCACYEIWHSWLSVGWWDGFFQAAGVVVVDDNDVDDDDVRSEGWWFNAVTI